MIIILQGGDGVGKTTLANALVKKLDAGYIHATWSKQLDCRMLQYHMNILLQAYQKVIKTGKPMILDRLWLSQSVYAEVFRHGSRYPFHGRMIQHFIDSLGGFTILCLADEQEHKKQFQKCKQQRIQMYDDVSNVIKVYNAFYYGDATLGKTLNDTYMKQRVMNYGVVNDSCYIKYDMNVQGKDLQGYAEIIKKKLKNNLYALEESPIGYYFNI